MKKIILLLYLICLGCSNNPVKKPKNLLDEDTVEDILFDYALLQATATTSPEVIMNNNIDIDKFIYKKYKIDSLTWAQNNKYYAGNVNDFKHLHKRVLKRLEEAIAKK
jgi:hypothetical protein